MNANISNLKHGDSFQFHLFVMFVFYHILDQKYV